MRFIPVPGWIAEPTILNQGATKSYHVIKCPRYFPDVYRAHNPDKTSGDKPIIPRPREEGIV